MNKIEVFADFPELSNRCKSLLQTLWTITLDFKVEHQNKKTRKLYRSYQSDLSQDEQQKILWSMVLELQYALSKQSQLLLREKCIEIWSSSLHSKAYLQWIMSSDVMLRASGELPLSLKMIVDATGAARSSKNKQSFNKLCSPKALDTELVLLPSLEPLEKELLHQITLESRRTGSAITVLVLVYIVLGRTQWPYQEYDSHVTKIVIYPDGNAAYEDHAMNEETRVMMTKNYLWYKCSGKSRGEYFYTNNQCKESDATKGNENETLKKKKPIVSKRPDWAYVGLNQIPEGCGGLIDPKILPTKLQEAAKYVLNEDVKLFAVRNSWNIRVYEMLQSELAIMEVHLNHTQVNEYQSWNISQCALAMLFDLYTNIPDMSRKRICDIFSKHPSCIQQSIKTVENRSGNNTLMNLFEKWLYTANRQIFEDSTAWCEINSLRIGDELSSALCICCGQTDAPEHTFLCEEDACPAAIHSFCMKNLDVCIDLNSPWYCDKHTPEAL